MATFAYSMNESVNSTVSSSSLVSYETFQDDSQDLQPWRVSVCTSANAINVRGFINELPGKFPDLNLDVKYFQLPYSNIDRFKFKGSHVNIMILCHSISRGSSITDNTDARYDKFLPNSANILGKARICVIVHDFPSSNIFGTPDYYRDTMKTFKSTQGTTFKQSSLVMTCGKMNGPVEMQETNWEDLKKFLVKAAKTPMPPKPSKLPKPPKPWWQRVWDFCPRRWLAILVVLVIIAAVAVGLTVGLGKSPPAATSTPNLPGSTPTTATTPTTISPKETTHPPTTISTTETDTTSNPTTTNRSMHRVYESSIIIISLFSIFMMI